MSKFSFYKSAVEMQKQAKNSTEKVFFDIVKKHAKKADIGNNQSIEWLKGHFGPRTIGNSIWDKNKIYQPEQVNLRGGIPALVRSVNRKSRSRQ